MVVNKFDIITKAIQAINPSAEFVLRDSNDDIDIDNETFTIEWHKGSAISKTDIKAKIDEIQPLETVYKNRQKEYPNVVDQLDDIYHNGIDGWVDRLDPGDVSLRHFARTDLLGGDPVGEFGCR